MEYQKMINLLVNKPNEQTKFGTKNGVEMNKHARGRYNTNRQIKFKTAILKPSLCDYSDAYILASGIIIVTNAGTAAARNIRKKIKSKLVQ